jgi:tryptophan synthase alpha chain
VDDEASQIATIFNRYEMDLISLIAPTTSDERLKKISGMASGFLYAVSRAGVTGAQSETSQSAKALVKKARQFSSLRIAVGFGISTAEQIAEVWDYADAAVVGSAIVRVVENSIEAGTTVERVKEFVEALLPQVANQVAEI